MHTASSSAELIVDDKYSTADNEAYISVEMTKDSRMSGGADTPSEFSRDGVTDDPWDIAEQEDTQKNWSELTVVGKIVRVLWIVVRLIIILCLLYFFVCSLDILQDAFQLLGGRSAGTLFTSSLINNPICGLMIGVLVTVLVQSSSTSSSIVVSMVGSGLLQVQQAIPIIMGANIGTTVTNTLVALTQSADRNTFRRAFAGATVHDMFNWLTVIILLPIEAACHYLYYLTEAMTQNVQASDNSDNPQFLKVITVPLTKLIIEVDKKVITAIAEGKDRQKFPLAKYYCKEKTEYGEIKFRNETAVNQTAFDEINNAVFKYNVKVSNETDDNVTWWPKLSWTEVMDNNSTKCSHLFVGSGLPGAALSEAAAGGILLAASLILMIVCLVTMVNTLNSLLRGPMAKIVRRTINADFPGCFSFLTGYVALLIGAGVTVLVQSSSVFTSALTPLVGIGVVTVERVYPLTLGSNIGTTVTSLLAALTADPNMIKYTIQISMCHLFFNISGILIWYPIPLLRRVPISLAKKLGNTTAKYRWFAVVYLILLYLLFPLAIFGLSVASIWALVGVGIPVIIIAIFVVIVNIIQSKRPNWLPEFLRSWDFLPLPLHSLEPYDRVITVCFRSSLYRKCCKCKSCGQESDTSEVNRASYTTSDNEKPHVPSEYRVEYSDLSKDGCVNESYDNTSDFHTSRM